MSGGLDEQRVHDMPNTVASDTLHKLMSLEYQFNVRDSMDNDKSHPKMNAVGTRHTTLLNKMTTMLGSNDKADKLECR